MSPAIRAYAVSLGALARMSHKITLLDNGWRAQCCSMVSDTAALRVFAFFHRDEGYSLFSEPISLAAWHAIEHTAAEDELSAGATEHAISIGAIDE